MSLLERITTISQLNMRLDSGLVCLTDTNEQGEIRYAYVTRNPYLKAYFNADEEGTFNILENEAIELAPRIYTGYAHSIAQLNAPDFQFEPQLLRLDQARFVDSDGNPAELINALEGNECNLVFAVVTDQGQSVIQVNEQGQTISGKATIFNAADVTVLERDGYLFIAKKHPPVFVSKDEIDSVKPKGKSKLLPAVAYVTENQSVKAVVLLDQPLG